MMATILNVGLNETTLRGLLRMTGNPRLPWDSYRRLVQSFAEVVDQCPAQPFEALLADESRTPRRDAAAGARCAGALAAGSRLPRALQEAHPARLSAGPAGAAAAGGARCLPLVERSPRAGIPPPAPARRRTPAPRSRSSGWYSAMPAGPPVPASRSRAIPSSGENRLYMDFAFNAQGEDIVSGRHAIVDSSQLGTILPDDRAADRRDRARVRIPVRGHAGVRVHRAGRDAPPPADAHRPAHPVRGPAHRRRPGPRGAARAGRGTGTALRDRSRAGPASARGRRR